MFLTLPQLIRGPGSASLQELPMHKMEGRGRGSRRRNKINKKEMGGEYCTHERPPAIPVAPSSSLAAQRQAAAPKGESEQLGGCGGSPTNVKG